MEEPVLEYLKIGDYVTFKSIKFEGYLSSEGILSEDLSVSDSDTNQLVDCMFCIHLQRQYSAARELNGFLDNGNVNINNFEDVSTAKYYKALARGCENEIKLNDTYMLDKVGTPVLYGDIIQLFHVKSGKYAQVIPDELAKDERENLKIVLRVGGDCFSWFKVTPRYKIDHIGDVVQNSTELFLKVAERPSEFLHVADRDPLPRCLREINCSLEATSWRMQIFQDSLDTVDKNILLSSQLVYINDPEIRCNVTISPHQIEIVNDDDVDEDYDDAISEKIDILLEPISKDINSMSLWYLESKSIVSGGPILWKTEQVRLKSLNTNLYMQMKQEVDYDDDGYEIDVYTIGTTKDPDASGTLFNVIELNSTGKILRDGKALQIHSNNAYIGRGDHVGGDVFYLTGSKDKQVASSFLINRYHAPVVTKSDPSDVFIGCSAKAYLWKTYYRTIVPSNDNVSSLWPYSQKSEFDFFLKFVDKIIKFSQGHSISATNIDLDVDKGNSSASLRRLNLFREQGIIEVVLRIINKLNPITIIQESVANGGKNASDSISNELSALLKMGQIMLEVCFKLIYYCVKDHHENQIYVADFLPVILFHLACQPLSGKCVTEMLSANMELQETKISEREIKIFVEKLRSSKMNSMYLKLLQSCCSCQGDGVDSNQCKIVNLLFENTNDIIIQLHADYTKTNSMRWNTGGYYISSNPDPGSPIKGDHLLTKGLPKLSIAWTTKSIDFSPLGLFGRLSVNIEELYAALSLKNNRRNPKKGSGGGGGGGTGLEQKIAVANYFISQLFLSAEMCMDRNYVAMNKQAQMYPYEALVSILKMDITDDLKGAVARLIMCLHVDCSPQAETKIPGLTRIYSDVQRNVQVVIPFVEPGRRNNFALLQDILHDYLIKMKGVRWHPAANHYLNLLHVLIKFNFYGTNDRLKDVIHSLIAVMDRRNVAVSSSSKGSGKSKKLDGKKVNPSSASSSKAAAASSAGKYEISNVDEESKEEFADLSREDSSKLEVDDGPVKTPWQETTLEFMESLPTMLAVLALVLAAVAITIYTTISGAVDGPGTGLYIWGIVVLIIFIMEVGIRAYCHTWVRGSFYTFVTSFFNIIDVVVISIDIVFLCLPTDESGGSGKFTKILRLVRMIRLLRVLRAARVVSAIINIINEAVVEWTLPERYSRVPYHELFTMVEAVDILLFAQNVIEDRNLSLLLRGFYLWESGSDKRTPQDIFNSVIYDARELSLSTSADFAMIFVDSIMFLHPPLVQSALDILMVYHSMQSGLLSNANKLQLIVSAKRERQFKLVDQMLQQLERNAETHELWGELVTDADRAQNKQTIDILKELTEICRIKLDLLVFDKVYEPDVEMQNLFRNLGCFTICLKVLDLLDSVVVDGDGTMDDVSANTQSLVRYCNELLRWFIYGNADNQDIAFGELDWFLQSLDANIGSADVVQAIFYRNEKLMKSVPHTIIKDIVERIVTDGRKASFLMLFQSITYVDEKNLVDNQSAIMKCIGSSTYLPQTGVFFVPVTHPSYVLKRSMMEPYLNQINVTMSDIPELLAYHFALIDVMAACTVGRLNITTVEAKVQSIYNYVDVISSMIDPGTIILGKIKMGRFLFNAVIEVEMMIPAFEHVDLMWKLLKSFVDFLPIAKHEVDMLTRDGWDSLDVDRNKLEYMLLVVSITGSFFERYYDVASFHTDDNEGIAGKVQLDMSAIDDIVSGLYMGILPIVQCNSMRLRIDDRKMLYKTLTVLYDSCKSISMPLPSEPIYTSPTDEKVVTVEASVLNQYREFIATINDDKVIAINADNESNPFVEILEQLPFIKDDVKSDLRYEGLITKLVSHISENINIVNDEKRMSGRCVKTTIWIIKALRKMIENRMGMSIYERDENGGEEQDTAAAPVIEALNGCGTLGLLIDLIAIGIDDELQAEAIKLCVAMLYKEGGALEVQKLMNTFFKSNNSELFFKQISMSIQKLIAAHRWNGVVILDDGQEPELLPEFIIIRFLQLMCEGHYLGNQDIMREQPFNSKSYNLLDDFVAYINCLTRIPCRTSTKAALAVTATILEVIQGPCVGNQTHFTLNTELLETLNRLLRAKLVNDCDAADDLELKKTGIDILQALLEGQNKPSTIYERVLSVLHFDVIKVLSGDVEEVEVVEDIAEPDSDDEAEPDIIISDEEVTLRTECVVLIQMLCSYHPPLRHELGISSNMSDITAAGTAAVEVVWNGVLQRRFFHIPELCHDVAKTSKDALVDLVDRSSAETKLVDFTARANELYREAKHQQRLKDLGISVLFTPSNQDRLTWLSFTLACTVNFILTAYFFTVPEQDDPVLPHAIASIVDGLNYAQIACASLVLIVFVVVRSPVRYDTLQAEGLAGYELILYTVLDFKVVYYFIYLLFCIGGIVVKNYVFIPLLLLDIIMKNSTTKDVLNSIIIPRKQLSLTMLICAFVTYIYTFFIFTFYRDDFAATDDAGVSMNDCNSFWNCFKATLHYGLNNPGGIGDTMYTTVGERYLLDLTYFLAVLIVVLNLIFGIIIMTFSSLREDKASKLENTTETCFICSIDRQVFDRASDVGDGFKTHISYDHHMWNYLYYIFFLWEQDKDDDDGLEQYIRRAVDSKNVSWYPMNKAMCLDQGASDDEMFRLLLQDHTKKVADDVTSDIDVLQADLGIVFEQLLKKLKIEDSSDDVVDLKPLPPPEIEIVNVFSSSHQSHNQQSMPQVNAIAEPKVEEYLLVLPDTCVTAKDVSIQLLYLTDVSVDHDFKCTIETSDGRVCSEVMIDEESSALSALYHVVTFEDTVVSLFTDAEPHDSRHITITFFVSELVIPPPYEPPVWVPEPGTFYPKGYKPDLPPPPEPEPPYYEMHPIGHLDICVNELYAACGLMIEKVCMLHDDHICKLFLACNRQ